ncbi:STAS domain-containing protein [Actinoplanes sp. NPDC026670]|uniref:STAS domain-containing protein n=1 Tax=Actinoplanes sp. NPDC026670 TaxID=3154700 RepID=UPI0033EEC134
MEVSSSRPSPGVFHVRAAGEIDMATVGTVQRHLAEAIGADDTVEVILNLAAVTFCDSSGIAAFDEAYGRATTRGIRFRVEQPQPVVSRILEIVGLLDALTGR